jgi:hypothetical protein
MCQLFSVECRESFERHRALAESEKPSLQQTETLECSTVAAASERIA